VPARVRLLAVPNVSVGSDPAVIAAVGAAFAPARVLDVHSDVDHGRSAFTLTGEQGFLADALLAGAREAVARIDLRAHGGLHPHVGAIDVAPVVYADQGDRGAACAEALTLAALLGEELELPVFLYGALATDDAHRERAALRSGGPAGLARRIAAGELRPDHGPPRPHLTAGAVLVTARPPLVAVNFDLESDDLALAREIAAGLRESGGGPPGVRAIGLRLPARGRAQVSVNIHDPAAVPVVVLLERIRSRTPVAEIELVGLAPRAALAGLPPDVPMRGFSPDRHLIESALDDRR